MTLYYYFLKRDLGEYFNIRPPQIIETVFCIDPYVDVGKYIVSNFSQEFNIHLLTLISIIYLIQKNNL